MEMAATDGILQPGRQTAKEDYSPLKFYRYFDCDTPAVQCVTT